MGSIADVFSKEDRIEVKISQFTEALKGTCEKEILMNAINCEVPYQYIREMITGNSEKEDVEVGSKNDSSRTGGEDNEKEC
ncbi:MAG: hypothetical protein HFJ09_05525 [Lachnospiraceae bacterium]|nr:hypothetical protein [Lachnospiraceae bacterium]